MAERLVHLVDDDDIFRDSMKALLEASGYSVRDHANAQQFLTAAGAAGTDNAACALVDVNMPDMDGLQLMTQCVERSINIPIVIVTGVGDVPMAVRAMKAGAIDFVEKPINADRLINLLSGLAAKAEVDTQVALFKSRLPLLTEREREVLEGIVSGHPSKVIAFKLGISPRTVDVHRQHLAEKLEVSGLSNLVRLALAAKISIHPNWAVK